MDNRSTIQRLYQAFGAGDLQGVLDLMAEDVEMVYVAPEDKIPWGGRFSGKEGAQRFFGQLLGTAQVQEFNVDEMVAEGNKVIALGNERWRVNETGREWTTEWAHVWTVEDGKVTRFVELSNSAAVAGAYQAG